MKKILAIDDQQDNLTTIKALLKNHIPDCKVLTALSGKEGLEIAEKEQPDTILLDIVMPRMDGYEVCKRLKEDESTKHIPVVMLTAIKTDSESRVRGLETGADAFLHKPIDPPELSAQIKVMLRIKAAEDKLRAEKELLDKKVEERTKELKESKERFQVALKNSPIMVWNQDIDLRYTWIHNPHPGFKPEEIIGKTDKELLPTDDAERLTKIKRNVLKNDVGTREEVRTTINGEPFYYDLTVEPLKDSNSAVVGITRASIDITDRKQTEEELGNRERIYKTLINNLPGFTYRCQNDKNWTMIYISSGCEEITGYLPEDFINNKNITFNDIIDNEYQQKLWDIWQNNLKEETTFEYEYPIIMKSQQIRWVWERGCGVYSDEGELLFLEGFITDITERKKAEAELIKHHENLEELVKERTAELEEKNIELISYNKLFEGREIRIKELRDKVKELEKKLSG